MERRIKAGHIHIFLGEFEAPIETTLEAIGDLDTYLKETTLLDDSPIVTITPLGESFLVSNAQG